MKQYFAAKITTLLQQAPFVGYLSRQKFVGQFILGRNVPFGEVAHPDGRRQVVADRGPVPGQVRRFARVQVDGGWGQAWVKAVAADAFIFLFATAGLNYLAQLYAKRWMIEQCFQYLKGRSFSLEANYLRCFQKLRKRGALVRLAYAFCLGVGAAAVGGRKNHGYRAASLSRHGLNPLRQLARPLTLSDDSLARLVETLLNWITRQLAKNQLLKIVG